MSVQVVTYRVDDSTVASFEIEPTEGFSPASAGNIPDWVKDAVAPAIEAARAVLDKAKEARPNGIELKFGVKVSGTASWLIARAATEGNFEITLRWSPASSEDGEPSVGEK